jgi:hypothetical protein
MLVQEDLEDYYWGSLGEKSTNWTVMELCGIHHAYLDMLEVSAIHVPLGLTNLDSHMENAYHAKTSQIMLITPTKQ